MLRSILTALARFFERRPRACSVSAPVATSSLHPPSSELQHVQDLIGQATATTSAVADDVGQHNATLETISAELTAVAQSDPTAVAAIVCKLVLANRELQGRLHHAEDSLRDHSRQLQAAVTSARTDSLTGLINRRALDETLRRCLADFESHGRPAALLMLDVDRFKDFNDKFGHLAGDHVLTYTAKLLHQKAIPGDVIARFGGEEFAIVFPGATAASVCQRAEQLRQELGKRMVTFGGQQMHVTSSAGLAELTAGDSVAQWIGRADEALYAAKNSGRNCAYRAHQGRLERLTLPTAIQPAALAAPSVPGPPPSPKVPTASTSATEQAKPRSLADSGAELAAEAFADTSFVQSIARRIAEWRRGGATLSVVLAQLEDLPHAGDESERENDTHSPIRVALQVARVCVREMDIITRWQRDGLAFLLPNTPAAEAKTVARRLRAALAANNADGRPRLAITIGIAEGIEGNDAKRVLERAWLALDAARCAGSGNIYSHDGLKAVSVKVAAVR